MQLSTAIRIRFHRPWDEWKADDDGGECKLKKCITSRGGHWPPAFYNHMRMKPMGIQNHRQALQETELHRPKRKQNRLGNYDYSLPNAYFITVCTKNKECLLWANDPSSAGKREDICFSDVGNAVRQCIEDIPRHYPMITVDHYAVMPNHIHLLVQIHTDENGRPMTAPTVSGVINQLKGAITKRIGFSLWQKGFHDHIVRGEQDYLEIWKYIEENPIQWEEDEFVK